MSKIMTRREGRVRLTQEEAKVILAMIKEQRRLLKNMDHNIEAFGMIKSHQELLKNLETKISRLT